MTDSATLLAEYVQNRSEPAFRELVARYINLVYAAAVRLVEGDTHLAEDVTQTVFAEFARLAHRVPGGTMGGWLHRHTCFVAAKTMRGERRRRWRERQAMAMNALEDHTPDNLARVAPMLDEAINELAAPEGTAIVLRFFDQRDFRSVGEALGSSEDAAQKRVARGLEKLRISLLRRGVALSGAALASALAGQAMTAAPAALAASVSSAALAGAAAGGGLTLAWLKIVAMTKLKLAVSAVVVAGVGTTLVLEHQAQNRLRDENASLRTQIEQLTQAVEDERSANAAARADANTALTQKQQLELLRLRGEVGSLRNQQKDLAKLQEENRQLRVARNAPAAPRPQPKTDSTAKDYYARESLVFAGYADAEAAFQSTVWALTTGDIKTALGSYAPELRARLEQMLQGKSESDILAQFKKEMDGVTGFRILKRETVSDDEAVLTVSSEGRDLTKTVVLKRLDNEWRIAGERPANAQAR